MKRKRMPKSIRKFIRKEKARIRREVLDVKEQERLISELYQKIFKELKIHPVESAETNLEQVNKAKNSPC